MSSRLSYSKGLAIPVILIKEYAYCPRYAYHMVFTNGVNRVTESMQLSPMTHATQHNQLIKNLCGGLTVLYEVPLSSGRLGVYGKVDAVCLGESEAVIIELKPLSGISARSLRTRHRHYLYQLAAYALIVEETLRKPVMRGYVVSARGVVEVKLPPSLKGEVLALVRELRSMLINEREPMVVGDLRKCGYCAFRRICGVPGKP
ncbi:MAG: CRISPR-associated protein Cas4 [Caldivirga sp.]|jgi:CRISPR-associated protein Cas4|nr:CRISPR-associated protein Cas4 [Caldivirga sp.]